MKRLSFLLVFCCMLLLFAGCDKTASTKDLYTAGADLIATMEDMIQSKDYAALLGAPDFSSVLEQADTGDYRTPTALYRITPPEAETLAALINNGSKEAWERLPENLKEQAENRMSFGTVVALINGQYGSEYLAFASLYVATNPDSGVRVNEETVFLYVFEKGTPIAVTFTEQGTVQGQFIFLPKAGSLEEVQAAFASLDCTVSEVDFR